jgi:hypothetical protein
MNHNRSGRLTLCPPIPAEAPGLSIVAPHEDKMFWRGRFDRVQVSSGRDQARFVVALARHIGREHRLDLGVAPPGLVLRARRKFAMSHHCSEEWLVGWKGLRMAFPAADDPRWLAQWLDVDLDQV